MPPTPKRPVVGMRGPITALIMSPLSAPGEHILDAASEHPCLQPSDSLPKLVEEGESPLPAYVSPPCPWPSYLFS